MFLLCSVEKLEASAAVEKPTRGRGIAGFILITGIDGIRYAVRQHAVFMISDLSFHTVA